MIKDPFKYVRDNTMEAACNPGGVVSVEVANAMATEIADLARECYETRFAVARVRSLLESSAMPFDRGCAILREIPPPANLPVNGNVALLYFLKGREEWVDCIITKVEGETVIAYFVAGATIYAEYDLGRLKLKP